MEVREVIDMKMEARLTPPRDEVCSPEEILRRTPLVPSQTSILREAAKNVPSWRSPSMSALRGALLNGLWSQIEYDTYTSEER